MLCIMNEVRDEGNCGEVTNRGEEACECAVKLTVTSRRQPHSRQSCEATNRNSIQGRSGQVSEPIIAKPSSFSRSGKSRACAAKVIRLIQGRTAALFELPLGSQFGAGAPWNPPVAVQGDPSPVSVRRACSKAERSVVNTVRGRRKSAEVVVLLRHTPLTTGRTEQ
jgi:hypothetical protein